MSGAPSLVKRPLRRAKGVASSILRRAGADGLERRLMNRADWAIAIYEGDDWTELAPAPATPLPVLSHRDVHDVPAEFVADPFMICREGGWTLFFEVMNLASDRGEIGCASSPDGKRWRYEGIVLREPFHLSYPYVFEHEGEVYLLPEAQASTELRLYRAVEFPTRWQHVHTLLRGGRFADPTLAHRHRRWWLFTETDLARRFDTLRLYSADRLDGTWTEHPRSPIVHGDARYARPAGRVVEVDGRLLRFAQDCHTLYGRQVWAFEITELTEADYAERLLLDRPFLAAAGGGWNGLGMHHVDLHRVGGRWMACVDGRSAGR